MGRTAHAFRTFGVDHGGMDERGIIHLIEDDLTESWVADWATEGVRAIESYLAKHLAFLSFLDDAAAA
jgi:hypothetical protein